MCLKLHHYKHLMQKRDQRLVLTNTVSYIVFTEILCPIISRDLLDKETI